MLHTVNSKSENFLSIAEIRRVTKKATKPGMRRTTTTNMSAIDGRTKSGNDRYSSFSCLGFGLGFGVSGSMGVPVMRISWTSPENLTSASLLVFGFSSFDMTSSQSSVLIFALFRMSLQRKKRIESTACETTLRSIYPCPQVG